jgi:hypothetical protein
MNRNTTHSTRSAGAPAYYMGRPAAVWQTALGSRTRSRTGARPSVDRTTAYAGVAGHPGVLS